MKPTSGLLRGIDYFLGMVEIVSVVDMRPIKGRKSFILKKRGFTSLHLCIGIMGTFVLWHYIKKPAIACAETCMSDGLHSSTDSVHEFLWHLLMLFLVFAQSDPKTLIV